jgi:hypothetical protein
MPRYYFHFSDGRRLFSDAAGSEFEGVGAARAYAIRHVRELKAAMCQSQIQDLSGWTMMVADARGRLVFEVGFDLKPVLAHAN